MRRPSDLINDNLEQVSLPEWVMELNKAVENPLCSANDIADIIMQDGPLSNHLLKVANNSFYNLASSVDSLPMAITLIGSRQLQKMILAITVVNHFQTIPDNLIPVNRFWQHNIACATASNVIARLLTNHHYERFFLAGLLHDIGRLLMYFAEPELSRRVIDCTVGSQNCIHQLEQEIFGFTHSAAGTELLRQWNFPESIIEPVQLHHSPHHARRYRLETAAVNLADAIANTLHPVISIDDDLPVHPNIWKYLGLSETMLTSLIDKTRTSFNDINEILYLPATDNQ